ncbi:MAG: AAA family ATPase [Acidobacteria bacterium]|nr:AAA family ATPase [Acidobacteriota bacterium]
MPFSLVLLLLLGFGLVAYFLARRSAGAPVEPASPIEPDEAAPPIVEAAQPPAPPAAPASREQRLAGIRTDLRAEYDASQFASEFEAKPGFVAAVEWMVSAEFDAESLYRLYSGDSLTLACAALVALARRPDGAALAGRVMASMSGFATWNRVFALRMLDAHVPPTAPLVGPVLAMIDDSWKDQHNGPVLAGFCASRIARGEQPTFAGMLDGLPASRLDAIEGYLSTTAALEPLKAELRQARARIIDLEFLQSFGRVLCPADPGEPPPIAHQALVSTAQAVVAALTADPPRSVVLIGPEGSGKSSLARSVSSRLLADGWTVFEAAPNELNAGQKFIGELEGRIQRLVREIQRGKRVVWLVRDIHGLAWTGATFLNPTAALDMLIPVLERGEIVLLGETEPAAYEKMLLQCPRLASVVDEQRVEPLAGEPTLALARAWVDSEHERGLTPPIGDATLREAWRLSQQYLTGLAAPGNLFQLLKSTLRRRPAQARGPQAAPVSVDEIVAALADLTGLGAPMLDERVRLDIAGLRRYLDEQVIGQEDAVACLVERVTMIKAGVTDPRRPLGVFLFVGPTGTGKTELAKALATFLSGTPSRMIRLDMSELMTPDAIGRLLGDAGPAHEHDALVDQIRRQPFSILLLDEFEKAHPAVWDLFLQVFDDGRLTDRRGKTADFRNAIVIITSNLGSIAGGGTPGFVDDAGRFSEHAVERAVSRAFRREFLNRIDRIVVFRPLDRETMRRILGKQLREVFTRRGLRNRQWAVEWDEAALEFLLERGFTPDLGARPLQRAIERYLLAPLADTIVAHEVPEGDQFLFVRQTGDALTVTFVDPDLPATQPAPDAAGGASLAEIAIGARGTADELAALAVRLEALEERVTSEAWHEEKRRDLELTGLEDFWKSDERFALLGRIEVRDRIERALASAASLLRRLRREDAATRNYVPSDVVASLASRLIVIATACEDLENRRPHDAFLLVETPSNFGPRVPPEATGFARTLAAMYRGWAGKRGMRLAVLEEASAAPAGYRFMAAVSGLGAHSLLSPEDGWHSFEVPANNEREFERWQVRVRVVPQPAEPPRERGDDLPAQARRCLAAAAPSPVPVVRRYRERPSALVRDAVRGYRTGHLAAVLAGDFDLIPS